MANLATSHKRKYQKSTRTMETQTGEEAKGEYISNRRSGTKHATSNSSSSHCPNGTPSPGGKSVKVRFINEGNGGTFTFTTMSGEDESINTDVNAIHRIGTWGCLTCVGVYFAVDDNRCFLAHINALREFGEHRDSRACTPAEGDRLKQKILEKLYKEAQDQDWRADDPRIRETIVIACPKQVTESWQLVHRVRD